MACSLRMGGREGTPGRHEPPRFEAPSLHVQYEFHIKKLKRFLREKEDIKKTNFQ